MNPTATIPTATPASVPPMTAGVLSLLAEVAARLGAVVADGAAVTTTMLTTVEACPSEFEVMEVNVWVDDSAGIVVTVAVQVLALICQPKSKVFLPSRVDENRASAEDMASEDGFTET